MMTSSYSSTSSYKLTFSYFNLEKQIFSTFFKTYYINELFFNSRIIDDIIYNEKSHIVSQFKDNLISDDCSEFLKRFYTKEESSVRLPRFFEYHETYSRIYPNYTAIPESKFIYKNIHKKQKIIDQQQDLEMSNEHKNKKRKHKESKCQQVFSTDVCNSLANDSSLMKSLFGLSKRNCNQNKNMNNKHIEQDNNNNSIDEIEKIIMNINKYQKEGSVNNTKHKKNISSSNSNISTRGKQPIYGLSKIYNDSYGNTISHKYNTIITSSHVITLSNHNINDQNTNTILNYNNNTYRMSHNKYITRLPNKHITTLSKEINKKSNANTLHELHLPKSSCITSNNSLVNHNSITHRKTISAHNEINSTKEKIKVNTNSNVLSSSAKATLETESIKNRIKRLSSNNTHNNSAVSNISSNNNNNNTKITYRNRIIPNKNHTLGMRTTNNSLNSYNKTNSTVKSNKNGQTIYTTSNIIKHLIPHSSKNRKTSVTCKRNGSSGSKTERLFNNKKKNKNEFVVLNQLISKTKSNSQMKVKPISARGGSDYKKKRNKNGEYNKKKEMLSSTMTKKVEKKISVNVLNKNNTIYKSSHASQKNIRHPIINDEYNGMEVQMQKNIVKGIQIKGFGKVIGLTEFKTPDNYSDNSRKKVINVNIKNNNTKYLAQTTRNIYRNDV